MFAVSAVLAWLLARPGLLGFSGALIYASPNLSAVLFSETASERAARRKAWLQFFTSIFFGLVAAEAFGPLIAERLGVHDHPEAIFFVIGLSVNGAWPAVERLLLRTAASRLLGAPPEKRGDDIDPAA